MAPVNSRYQKEDDYDLFNDPTGFFGTLPEQNQEQL
jgi:hypothetical protein